MSNAGFTLETWNKCELPADLFLIMERMYQQLNIDCDVRVLRLLAKAMLDEVDNKELAATGTLFDYGFNGETIGEDDIWDVVRDWCLVNNIYDPLPVTKSNIIKDIFGNLFYIRASPALFFKGQTWLNNVDVQRMAQSIYMNRSWEAMPVLSDALEEAGCNEERILQHLRRPLECVWCRGTKVIKQSFKMGETEDKNKLYIVQPTTEGNIPCPYCSDDRIGKHYRGCWVLDLIFNKR